MMKYFFYLNMMKNLNYQQQIQLVNLVDQMKKILYYSIISKYVEFDSTCKTRIVQLSKDGIKLDKIVGYY